ncbi:MAG TPA: AI-2E family transporter [Methanocellaceae archaeon]|jgi:predicted PurR-regulated permease PerM
MEGLLSKVYDAKWIIFGLVLILLLLWVAWPFVNVLFYAIFLYYATRPLKLKLKRYIKNETLLVTMCMFLLVLPILLIVSYTLLLAVAQLNTVTQSVGLQSLQEGPLANMSIAVSTIQHSISIDDIKSGNFSSIVSQSWYQTLSGYSGSISGIQGIIYSTGMTIISLIFKVFLMIIIAFYLLREDDRLVLWFKSTFPALVGERDGLLVRYMKAVDNDLQKIFFGNILSIVFFAFLAVILFTVLNIFVPDPTLSIPSPILLGILCGVSALLPLVGMFVITVPMFVYILVQALMAGTLMANLGYFVLMVVVVLLLLQILPGFFIGPMMARSQVNTGLLMFAYILGPIVFGIAGLFIGAIVLVLLTQYFKIIVPQLAKDNAA